MNEAAIVPFSASGLTCIGFGIATLLVAALAVVEDTRDATRRVLYRRLLMIASALATLLAMLLSLDAAGVVPPWTADFGFALCFLLGIPALIWFSNRVHAMQRDFISPRSA